jgi:hypothetical protein
VRKFMFAFVAGIALSGPAMAQDVYHIRVGDRVYDIRTGLSDGGVVLSGPVQRRAGSSASLDSRWVPAP